MATKIQTVQVNFNPVFRSVNECRTRYRALKGSAGSGKSVDIAQDYILKLMDMRYKGANLLVVRKVEGSNKDSTFAELLGAISRACGDLSGVIWDITLNPLAMRCTATGNRIIFRGMNDARQREKVKSISFPDGKLTWIWCEEATELEEADVDILDDRLRGVLVNPNLYYQITFTFNPINAGHWIKRKCFDIESPDIFTHHSTYRDNRFIDEAYYRRMELRRVQDPEGYKVYGLGEWGRMVKENGAVVLTAQQPFATELIVSSGRMFKFRYELIWEKAKALGFLNANKMPLRAHENILVFYRHLPTYMPQMTHGTPYKSKDHGKHTAIYGKFREQRSENNTGTRYPRSVLRFPQEGQTDHPTEKPQALFEWLIRTYTIPGETVLDNCMGSGTTAAACETAGRRWIGMEMSEEFCLMTKERIENAIKERGDTDAEGTAT